MKQKGKSCNIPPIENKLTKNRQMWFRVASTKTNAAIVMKSDKITLTGNVRGSRRPKLRWYVFVKSDVN